MHFPILSLPTFADARGALTVLEGALPFAIARIYWIHAADGQTRGGHRHKETRQALVAVHGSVSVYMNDGVREETIKLQRPSDCLLVEPKDWHTFTLADDAVVLVLASHPYDRADYIDEPYVDAPHD
ncbi:hypothetical protein GIW81_09965 [Hyphomicrobium sp. xq]|uniref:Sugar 3,4-ketoisomerase QdtA cupin domain-containing protein n=1 Tax=Hyphomicrobium album TaxID=2665159 RepID=A0A6I3KG99_9HYPH|nr:FdtA/QdtA family cupin domain-containing protein [Hyphomicrobium album]MTD94655.1 hypothetical protein [Hyphomicrobium album]